MSVFIRTRTSPSIPIWDITLLGKVCVLPNPLIQNLPKVYKFVFKPVMNYKSYGEKSFYFYGPLVWNSLPYSLRSIDTLDSFKKQLKTFLFKKAFNV